MVWLGLATLNEGKDALDEFEDAGHSKSAREQMETFYIGELDPSSPATRQLDIVSKEQPVEITKKLKDLTEHYWTVPVTVVGISVVVGLLYWWRKWGPEQLLPWALRVTAIQIWNY